MNKMTDDDSQANPTKMLQLLVGVQEEKRQLVISNYTTNQEPIDDDIDEELLLERLDSLKKELLKESNEASLVDMLQKNALLGQILSEEMFAEETPFKSNTFSESSLKQLDMESDIKRISQEIESLKGQLQQTKETNLK